MVFSFMVFAVLCGGLVVWLSGFAWVWVTTVGVVFWFVV